MRRLFFLFLFFHTVLHLPAQYKIRFVVKELTTLKRDSIFIAGNFNTWNPVPDNKYKLEPYGPNEKSIVLNLPAGHYEYKYHGGSWLKVEKQGNGEEINNRRIYVTKDTVIHDKVAEWRDLFFKNKGLINSGETKEIDDLKQQLIIAKDDSHRISIMEGIGFYYEVLNVDSSLKYTQTALAFARKHSYVRAEARAMASLSSVLRQQGKFAEAMELLFKSLRIALENNYTSDIARAYRRLGLVYFDLENYPKVVTYLLKAADIDEKSLNAKSAAIDHILLGEAYEKMNKLDSAASHIDIAFKQKDYLDFLGPDINNINGNIQVKKRNYNQALFLYKEAYIQAQKNSDLVTSSKICAGLANLFIKIDRRDSAIFYALKGFEYGQKISYKKGIILTGNLLSELYDSIQPVEALKYYRIAAVAKDSLFGVNNIQTIQDLVGREESRQKELEDARTSYRNKLKLYGLVAGSVVLLVLAFILYRNNIHKQKANVLLHQQKEKIQATLTTLQSTQAQLIQSEKLASLGELTAGIAHEIQNPLNFVNNFSELNRELISEMEEEIEKGNLSEVKLIATDLAANEEKINHHGQRASGIVKSMLEHSRTSTGTKEPTDLNALADEYLRLAYHGLRAKDSSFNAKYELIADPNLPKVDVIPQDMGRVLLNLISNAFYAVHQRNTEGGTGNDVETGNDTGTAHHVETGHALSLQQQQQPPQQQPPYQPTVTISTQKIDNHIVITVKDNGNGIPESIKDKIFQPFFTTKPTGQGTGLGLSLSYDIVTKGHGGTLEVDSREGDFTTFCITLPVSIA